MTKARGRGSEKKAPEQTEEPAGDVDWGNPEKVRKASGLWVALWLFVPLVGCIVYGFFTR